MVSLAARVTSVKSTQGLRLTDGQPDPTIGPQVYLGPIKSALNLMRLELAFDGKKFRMRNAGREKWKRAKEYNVSFGKLLS